MELQLFLFLYLDEQSLLRMCKIFDIWWWAPLKQRAGPGRAGMLHGPRSKPAISTTDVDSKLVTTLICLHSRTMHAWSQCQMSCSFWNACISAWPQRVQYLQWSCLIGLCSGFILIWRQIKSLFIIWGSRCYISWCGAHYGNCCYVMLIRTLGKGPKMKWKPAPHLKRRHSHGSTIIGQWFEW